MASPSKSAKSSNGKSVSSIAWRSKSVGSSSKNWRNPKAVVSGGHDSWSSRTSPLSPDSSVSPRNIRQSLTSQVIEKAAKVFRHGKVLSVNYERNFGFLAPINGDTSASSVYFKVPPPGDQLTSTLTGGMLLIPGDLMEYELSNSQDNQTSRAHFARLRECKPRTIVDLVEYVKSLVTTAEDHPEIVLRNVTKCSVGIKLVLDHRDPSQQLLRHTLELCQILSSSKLAGLYHSRLKQMYTLFSGSQFLASEFGVRKLARYLSRASGSQDVYNLSDLLKTFLLHLLEYIPSQLPLILPLLTQLGECQKSRLTLSIISEDLEKMLPVLGVEAKEFLTKLQDIVSLSCEAESFFRNILNVLAGGSTAEKPELIQPWSQLPLLPTMEEVRTSNRRRSTLPVVKQKGPYNGPEEYIDTYLRLLREDSVAGLLQGIHRLREWKVDDCDMKLWFHVSTVGVHFNYNASPGLTFAVTLPKMKDAKAFKAPLGGSLVCFFDDGGGFDTPIWGVVSRCEEDADKTCVCFVDVIVQSGVETELNSASWSFQCARLIKGEDMVMAESPTYYRAYQPVLEALQLTDPDSVPFREELVFVTWPEEPAPDYLKSTSGATLDWSCIFEVEETAPRVAGFGREIREGVGAVTSLSDRGYKTTFDPSQLKAVELAVNNRLAIIQGPPGTGKTYIGVKLLQLLLSASTYPRGSPVFVITFKNHALDQFLEKCLAFCHGEDSIVRVGGRSNCQNLEKYKLQYKIKDDEFRFDRLENYQKLKAIRQEMEGALADVNRYLQSFDPRMILVHSPELHLNYFLQSVAHPARIETCISRLPEDVTLAELIRGQIPENADRTLVSDIVDFSERLVAEMGKWMPRPEVLQTAQAFYSLRKPSSSKILQRNISSVKHEIDEEQDESRREEEERRSAYESLRQDINLELDVESKRTDYRWFFSDFMKFAKEKDVHRTSVTYHRFNLDSLIGSQFDWLAHENPYDLLEEHRAILVFKYWQESVDAACERLARIKAKYDIILQDTEQIGERRKLAILQKAQIVGMTTTGAAIHQSVLKHLSPAVVLVEEAAEILEPQVLAFLNSNLQHLILIGDHHQLRPQVESYDLERWHGFGVSMFERLVEHNNLPYQPLGLQCRMREEFVPMLLQIYPFLRSHIELVTGSRNEAPTCMLKTMYFWSHTYEETSQRSYVNQKEAQMVVALARWIVSEVEDPQSLKVLAAYNGQVTLIRKLLGMDPKLEVVEVRSIDSFQGAESEIVIVSLVRSNEGGNIGHLSMRNRMCVAASRARCGVYFVGNRSTLAHKSDNWRTLISYFEDQNAIDSSIPLCCPRHPDRPAFALSNAEVSKFKPSDVCDYPCEEVLTCGHVCSYTCHCGAHIRRCKERVDFTFRLCGHSQIKMCSEDEETLSCKTKVMHKFKHCKHSTEKECWEVEGARKLPLKCQVLCGKELKCGHLCKLHCSEICASAPCGDCQEIEREKERIKLQILIKAIESKQKELDVEIQKLQNRGNEGIVVKQVHPDDDTAQAFFMAKDRAEKYIQPDCKVMIVVTKVEKIENLKLQEKFLKAQKDLTNPLEIPEWLFYGGPDDLLDQVVYKGFRVAHQKAHLFDVYSSRIAQKHDNHCVLLCEVHLGKPWRPPSLESLKKDLDSRKLRKKGYDSVTLVGGQENEDELRPFAHIIFNPEQAIPRFIVSYKLMDIQALAEANNFERFGEQQASRSGGMCRLPLMPSLNFQGATPEECHFRMAESQFLRMSENRRKKVIKVEFIKNVELEQRYGRKKEEFETSNVAVEERFVFHGTDSDAIDKIATVGFKIGGKGVAIKVGAAYGHGVYTAVNPDISVAYSGRSNMMLLSLAILGKFKEHYNYGETKDVIVIKDVDQLLPRYVVHYR